MEVGLSEWLDSRDNGVRGEAVLLALWTRWWDMFAGIVFLYLDEILLCVRADLNDVFRTHVAFDLLPRPAVLFQRFEKELVFFFRPIFSVFGYYVLLAWFFRWWGL